MTASDKATTTESKGIVIRIKPQTVARCMSVGLGIVIQICTVVKKILDQSLLRDNEEENVPACQAVPIPDIKGDEDTATEILSKEQADKADWKQVEKSIQEGVESVDWDQVGRDIKEGVESVDWEGVGNKLEEWCRSVDWDQVGKSISDAFDQTKEKNTGNEKNKLQNIDK